MNITRNLIVAVLMTVVTTVLLGVVYPLVITGLAQAIFPDQANGQLIEQDGKVVGSRHHRSGVLVARLLSLAAVGGRHRLRRRQLGRHQPGTDEQEADRCREGGRRGCAEGESRDAGADRSRHLVGVRARPAHLAGGGRVPGAADCPRAHDLRSGRASSRGGEHGRTSARLLRRARRQRPGAQSRARSRIPEEEPEPVTDDRARHPPSPSRCSPRPSRMPRRDCGCTSAPRRASGRATRCSRTSTS